MNYDLINKSTKSCHLLQITFSKKQALELTECIKIDKELHHHNSLKLFFKGCPIALLQ